MPLYVQTNVASMIAQRSLNTNTFNVSKNMERLSSGFRINRGSDDAAGLYIANSLTAQIRGTAQASRNTQEGINVLNIADGAFNVIQNNLQRIRELTVQAANDTNGDDQREAIKDEITSLKDEIDQIAKSTKYNGKNLLNSAPASFRIQVGAGHDLSLNTINVASAMNSATASDLGLGSVTVSSNSQALAFLDRIDTALDNVSTKRAKIGAFVNRLQSALDNLANLNENQTAARSTIQDADIAAEAAGMTKNQILQQAALSVLSQANQAPGLALRLIGG